MLGDGKWELVHSADAALWVEFAEIQTKVAPGNFPQKCPKNDDSHTTRYLFGGIQLISADFDCFSLNSEVLTNFAYNPSTKPMFSPVTSVSVMKISWYQLILEKK